MSNKNADDDTPLDYDWVQSVLPVIPGRGAVLNDRLSLFNSRHGWGVHAGSDGADDSFEAFAVMTIQTRGQVRVLSRLLGITLNECESP